MDGRVDNLAGATRRIADNVKKAKLMAKPGAALDIVAQDLETLARLIEDLQVYKVQVVYRKLRDSDVYTNVCGREVHEIVSRHRKAEQKDNLGRMITVYLDVDGYWHALKAYEVIGGTTLLINLN